MVCWMWFQLLWIIGLCFTVAIIEFWICYVGLSTCFYVWILSRSYHIWIWNSGSGVCDPLNVSVYSIQWTHLEFMMRWSFYVWPFNLFLRVKFVPHLLHWNWILGYSHFCVTIYMCLYLIYSKHLWIRVENMVLLSVTFQFVSVCGFIPHWSHLNLEFG